MGVYTFSHVVTSSSLYLSYQGVTGDKMLLTAKTLIFLACLLRGHCLPISLSAVNPEVDQRKIPPTMATLNALSLKKVRRIPNQGLEPKGVWRRKFDRTNATWNPNIGSWELDNIIHEFPTDAKPNRKFEQKGSTEMKTTFRGQTDPRGNSFVVDSTFSDELAKDGVKDSFKDSKQYLRSLFTKRQPKSQRQLSKSDKRMSKVQNENPPILDHEGVFLSLLSGEHVPRARIPETNSFRPVFDKWFDKFQRSEFNKASKQGIQQKRLSKKPLTRKIDQELGIGNLRENSIQDIKDAKRQENLIGKVSANNAPSTKDRRWNRSEQGKHPSDTHKTAIPLKRKDTDKFEKDGHKNNVVESSKPEQSTLVKKEESEKQISFLREITGPIQQIDKALPKMKPSSDILRRTEDKHLPSFSHVTDKYTEARDADFLSRFSVFEKSGEETFNINSVADSTFLSKDEDFNDVIIDRRHFRLHSKEHKMAIFTPRPHHGNILEEKETEKMKLKAHSPDWMNQASGNLNNTSEEADDKTEPSQSEAKLELRQKPFTIPQHKTGKHFILLALNQPILENVPGLLSDKDVFTLSKEKIEDLINRRYPGPKGRNSVDKNHPKPEELRAVVLRSDRIS